MRVLGVIDLLSGRAVHAVAGERDRYQPVNTVAGTPIPPGDGQALASADANRGVDAFYVADLDAIQGGAAQDVSAIVSLGHPVWLDAAARTPRDAVEIIARGSAGVVVGLETLPGWQSLGTIVEAVGPGKVTFSLDLRNGRPITAPDLDAEISIETAIDNVLGTGVRSILVLDLARVGTGSGLDFGLIGRLRARLSGCILFAGGGVRNPEDLRRLDDIGVDGVLIASALQNGAIRRGDVSRIAGRRR